MNDEVDKAREVEAPLDPDPVYPSQEELLADQNGLAQPPPEGVKLPPSRAIPLAGFAVTILGRV